jgi:hypothetical protein
MSQDPRWRDFEKLIALIERHLGPKGAVVRSPDHFPDKVTGQDREVDASVRYQVGSVPVLVTIECRDRTSTEDVTWIEQLIAKRESIGASVTVAVSSTGFSGPALAKAKASGIEVRTLKDVSEDAIRDWAQGIEIVVVRGTFGLGQLRVQFTPSVGDPIPKLGTEVLAGYAKGDVEFKFIRRIADNSLISIGDLLRESDPPPNNDWETQGVSITLPPKTAADIPVDSSFSSLFADVHIDAPPVVKTMGWTFDPGEALVLTDRGPVEIVYVDVEFSVAQRAYPSQVGRLLSYDNPERRIATVEQRDLTLGNGRVGRAIISGREPENET